jgi:hypothetical protein
MPLNFEPRLDILPASQRLLWPELDRVPEDFVLYGGYRSRPTGRAALIERPVAIKLQRPQTDQRVEGAVANPDSANPADIFAAVDNLTVGSTTPEPQSVLLLLGGLAAGALRLRRRNVQPKGLNRE